MPARYLVPRSRDASRGRPSALQFGNNPLRGSKQAVGTKTLRHRPCSEPAKTRRTRQRGLTTLRTLPSHKIETAGSPPLSLDLLQAFPHHGGQRVTGLLGISKQHLRVLLVKHRVVEVSIASAHGSLAEDHLLGAPNLNHRHAPDRAAFNLLSNQSDKVAQGGSAVLSRRVHDIVGTHHQHHVLVLHVRIPGSLATHTSKSIPTLRPSPGPTRGARRPRKKVKLNYGGASASSTFICPGMRPATG